MANDERCIVVARKSASLMCRLALAGDLTARFERAGRMAWRRGPARERGSGKLFCRAGSHIGAHTSRVSRGSRRSDAERWPAASQAGCAAFSQRSMSEAALGVDGLAIRELSFWPPQKMRRQGRTMQALRQGSFRSARRQRYSVRWVTGLISLSDSVLCAVVRFRTLRVSCRLFGLALPRHLRSLF